jgi:hypothetical protein
MGAAGRAGRTSYESDQGQIDPRHVLLQHADVGERCADLFSAPAGGTDSSRELHQRRRHRMHACMQSSGAVSQITREMTRI